MLEQPIGVEQRKPWVPQLFYLRLRIEPSPHFVLILTESISKAKETHPSILSSSSSRQNTKIPLQHLQLSINWACNCISENPMGLRVQQAQSFLLPSPLGRKPIFLYQPFDFIFFRIKGGL
jgi:hypothetical protein